MGRRGPRPAPTALKLLRGETRPSRVNYRAPKPLPTVPEKPVDLDAGAAPTWDLVVAGLGPTGVLSPIDGLVLRILAEAAARYQASSAALAASGPLIRGARAGELIKNLLLARELGATPSARAGLRAPVAEPGARLTAFLAEGRRG